MKALTICQPYPYLICLPAADPRNKRVENRKWYAPYRGELAIHAGKSDQWLDSFILEPGEEDRLVFGAIVAVARLAACLHIEKVRALAPGPLHWASTHRHAEGPWCWILQDVRVLRYPVPAPGRLSLWDWEPTMALDFLPGMGDAA